VTAAAWGAGAPRAARRRAVVLLLLARERERRAAVESGRQSDPEAADGFPVAPPAD
jgi:hypothetical protein